MLMDDLLGNSWLVVAAMIAASILAILYMVSIAIRGQMHAHDLQVSVARLQQQYHARIRAMQEAAQLGGRRAQERMPELLEMMKKAEAERAPAKK